MVIKLFMIFWIFGASTSCQRFCMRNFEETSSSTITDDFLPFFDVVIYLLFDDIGVSLSTGVAIRVFLLESPSWPPHYLRSRWLWALLIALITCFAFVNILATFVFNILPSINMDSDFITSSSTQDFFAYTRSNGLENWCMKIWTVCTANFLRITSR